MTYRIKQEKFEGPLDLLLTLVQERKLSINEISLAAVTDEFVGYLQGLEADGEADKEMLAEFLVVASQLLLIKSRSLLPQFNVSPEEEASIEELENRLNEYRQIKEIARELDGFARGGPKSFTRPAYAGREIAFLPPKNFTAGMLAEAFERILQAVPKAEKLVEEKIRKVISLEEKIRHLQALLAGRVERAFSELVAGAKEKVEIIVSFLAILELARQKFIAVKQKSIFDEITIRKMT